MQIKPGKIGALVSALGSDIVLGKYSVGAALPPEHELAVQYGSSRSVVREAVKMLAAKGLVSVRQRHGTHVRPRADWSMLDRDVLTWLTGSNGPEANLLLALEEVRSIIEPAAAALAAARGTEEDHRALRAALRAMEAGQSSQEAAIAADKEFHLAVLAATHNPVLQSFRGAIDSILSAIFLVATGRLEWFEANIGNHADVVDAIIAREPERARAAMERTLGYTRGNLAALPAARAAGAQDDPEISTSNLP
jgi:GntR family galactonate operon transcriptional repressor